MLQCYILPLKREVENLKMQQRLYIFIRYSYGPSSTTHKPTSTKELQQEDSKAVWNELSHYKAACEELVKQKYVQMY